MKKIFPFLVGILGLVVSLFALNKGEEELVKLYFKMSVYTTRSLMVAISISKILGWVMSYYVGGVIFLSSIPEHGKWDCRKHNLLPLLYMAVTISLEYFFLWR